MGAFLKSYSIAEGVNGENEGFTEAPLLSLKSEVLRLVLQVLSTQSTASLLYYYMLLYFEAEDFCPSFILFHVCSIHERLRDAMHLEEICFFLRH